MKPVFITERGKAAAVLISADAYAKSEHDRELLKALLRGDREISAGIGFDIDTVMAEADALLAKP